MERTLHLFTSVSFLSYSGFCPAQRARIFPAPKCFHAATGLSAIPARGLTGSRQQDPYATGSLTRL
jgi:hypothetical protein